MFSFPLKKKEKKRDEGGKLGWKKLILVFGRKRLEKKSCGGP